MITCTASATCWSGWARKTWGEQAKLDDQDERVLLIYKEQASLAGSLQLLLKKNIVNHFSILHTKANMSGKGEWKVLVSVLFIKCDSCVGDKKKPVEKKEEGEDVSHCTLLFCLFYNMVFSGCCWSKVEATGNEACRRKTWRAKEGWDRVDIVVCGIM